jgi:hypothetical protein
VAFQFSNDEQTATAQIGGGTGSPRRWALTASGPLAKKGPTTLATGEGLNAGFNAEFLLRNLSLSTRSPVSAPRVQEICDTYLDPAVRARRALEAQDNREARQTEQILGAIQAHTDTILRALGKRTQSHAPQQDPSDSGTQRPLPQGCRRAELTEEGKDVLDAEAFTAVWAYGASVKVGRTSFDYTDPVTFADESETHDGWSASVSLGRFQDGPLSAILYYVGASYRHEEAYHGGSARNVCTPISGTTSTLCRDIAIGAPQRRSSDLVQVEARSFLGSSVGMAPRATYEINEQAWFVDVPVYLRNGSGPFNGGVSLGWDSVKDDIVVSLFVGALPRLLQ